MAEICCGVVNDSEASATPSEGSARAARRRRMDIRRFKFVAPETKESNSNSSSSSSNNKRRKIEVQAASLTADSAMKNKERRIVVKVENGKSEIKEVIISPKSLNLILSASISSRALDLDLFPKYGVASVCGRRRDMEDVVAICPSFFQSTAQFHYFGVYDGHGCSHVAMRCRERLHELVKEELLERKEATTEWKMAMEKSFWQMDKEVIAWTERVVGANCRCEMQIPECDAVGSTAVVAIITTDKIIVANCGDSRAVLCRNGKPIPLSTDHKPDRPDELSWIQAAGVRVIYWDGPRVLGVLAMSRAISDNYLKPFVSCEPEVTITDRKWDDDYLILASDGLWDVVPNDTACRVARMCLKGKGQVASVDEEVMGATSSVEKSDKACSEASMLLTKLALARHSTDNVSVVVVDLSKDT